MTEIIRLSDPRFPGVDPGMFRIRLEKAPFGHLKLHLFPQPNGKGVHESFWKNFVDFLERKSNDAVIKNMPYAAEFVAGVVEISGIINSGAARKAVWYSSLRNEINYQHKYGVWYPLENSKKILDKFVSLHQASSASVRLDISRDRSPVMLFVSLSQFLATLSFELAEHVAARSQGSTAFGAKWRRLRKLLA